MNKLKIKAFVDSDRLVSIKWIYSRKYDSDLSFTGFISAEYFSEIIATDNYKRLSGNISREEMSFFVYEHSEKIISNLISTLRAETYKEIALADEMTMTFLLGLGLPKKIMNKVAIKSDVLKEIDDLFGSAKAREKYNVDDIKSQVSLLAHMTGVIKKVVDDGVFPENVDESSVHDLYNLLATSGVCWEATFRYSEPSQVSRTAVMTDGPLLATEKDPWPGDNGALYDPLCQIPTDLVRIFTDYSGSAGMAQFYLADDIYSRVIEIGEPVNPPEIVFKNMVNYRGVEEVFEIIGLKPPQVYICSIHDNLIDNVAGMLSKSDIYLFSLLKMISTGNKVRSPHFMGSFHPLQYGPNADRQCILAIEHDNDRNFGDNASAQIFLGKNGLYGLASCY